MIMTFKLTPREVREFRDRGYVARKGMTVIYPRIGESRGNDVAQNSGWTVYVRGKGYVRNYYGTKWAALASAEYDEKRNTCWGRDVTEEDVNRISKNSLAHDIYSRSLAHLQNTLKKES